ncbi:MAG: GNAT family N-acetyltransferase [Minisyncoccales bacterium]
MKLVKPTKKYGAGWKRAVEELKNDSESIKLWEVLGDPDDLDLIIKTARLHSQGKNLPSGWMPYDIYWLVEGEEVIGIVSIRHKLNADLELRGGHIGAEIVPSERGKGYGSKMRELVLPKLKKLGIKKVLMTSFDDNIASYRIIEKHGGKLENKIKAEGENDVTRRYWIDL